ncbi:unnamed protein product [Amoebophrya sp. A120]|nr:unnamed protein product [Amoebophrya sp. A120]|eukprot:GSA120T00014314001.1
MYTNMTMIKFVWKSVSCFPCTIEPARVDFRIIQF